MEGSLWIDQEHCLRGWRNKAKERTSKSMQITLHESWIEKRSLSWLSLQLGVYIVGYFAECLCHWHNVILVYSAMVELGQRERSATIFLPSLNIFRNEEITISKCVLSTLIKSRPGWRVIYKDNSGIRIWLLIISTYSMFAQCSPSID